MPLAGTVKCLFCVAHPAQQMCSPWWQLCAVQAQACKQMEVLQGAEQQLRQQVSADLGRQQQEVQQLLAQHSAEVGRDSIKQLRADQVCAIGAPFKAWPNLLGQGRIQSSTEFILCPALRHITAAALQAQQHSRCCACCRQHTSCQRLVIFASDTSTCWLGLFLFCVLVTVRAWRVCLGRELLTLICR
jgi:hypothetical protein